MLTNTNQQSVSYQVCYTASPSLKSYPNLATQEERRRNTRQAIVESAFTAYAKQGSPEVALESIAEDAGVTKGTIHYHFRNRSGLMRAVAVSVFQEIEARINLNEEPESDNKATRYLTAMLTEQATPAGRVLFTIGDELARTGDLQEIDPFVYLGSKLQEFGLQKRSDLIAAAVTQYARQLAYGLAPASAIEGMIMSLALWDNNLESH
ncbi:MAG: AcrR family transcriptional regulator [Candidatus Azotimanducaceae bacterium]